MRVFNVIPWMSSFTIAFGINCRSRSFYKKKISFKKTVAFTKFTFENARKHRVHISIIFSSLK